MNHCIIAKFRAGYDWRAELPRIRALFDGVTAFEGVTGVHYYSSCSDRPNRYHLMIVIDCTPEGLAVYDASDIHRIWKETYGGYLAEKAIFDYHADT